METTTPRWTLLDTTTNEHGTTYFTLSFYEAWWEERDYHELDNVLRSQFGATEQVPIIGPYSTHKHYHVEGLCLGVILDAFGEIPLYAMDELGRPAMEAFVKRLLAALNEGDEEPSSE